MELNRLFGVLVVGGSLLVAAACDDGDPVEKRGPGVGDEVDAAAGGVDAASSDLADAEPGTGELAPCFCDTQECCQRDTEVATVQEGFECCWMTTCP